MLGTFHGNLVGAHGAAQSNPCPTGDLQPPSPVDVDGKIWPAASMVEFAYDTCLPKVLPCNMQMLVLE